VSVSQNNGLTWSDQSVPLGTIVRHRLSKQYAMRRSWRRWNCDERG
jgi:hypothetical protein